MNVLLVIFFTSLHFFTYTEEIGIFAAPHEKELIATLLASYKPKTDSYLYFLTLLEVIDNHYKNPIPPTPPLDNLSSSPVNPAQEENPSLLRPDGKPYIRGPYIKKNCTLTPTNTNHRTSYYKKTKKLEEASSPKRPSLKPDGTPYIRGPYKKKERSNAIYNTVHQATHYEKIETLELGCIQKLT